MRIRTYIAIIAAAVIFAPAMAFAQSTPIATGYSVFNNWLPIVIIASTLAVLLASVYYMLGWMLNNTRMKSNAVSELQHAGGSILLVVLLIWLFWFIGSGQGLGFSNILGAKQSQVSSMCNVYLANSPVTTFNSVYYDSNGGNLPSPTTAVCQGLINNNAGIAPVTRTIDYGLAATYVIIANMSNQSAAELNYIYNFESMIFFLRNLNPSITVSLLGSGQVTLGYKPYAGYVLHRTVMPSILVQGTISMYLFTIELVLILIVLMGWPYLLAGGIILRTIPYTRRVGGLIIAATIVAVVIFPAIFLFEYSSLSNISSSTPFIGAAQLPGVALCGFGQVPGLANAGSSPPGNVLYCYTDSTSLPANYIYKDLPEPSGINAHLANGNLAACSSSYNDLGSYGPGAEYPPGSNPLQSAPECYVKRPLNFYVYPKASDIVRMYSCYIGDSSTVFPFESIELTNQFLQIGNLPVDVLLSFFTNSVNLLGAAPSLLIPGAVAQAITGSNPLAGHCITTVGPYYITAAISGIVNMYGIISVSAFILPIINALMIISAITGISSLMGGETTIIGLSRFV